MIRRVPIATITIDQFSVVFSSQVTTQA